MIVNREVFMLKGTRAGEAWALIRAEMTRLHPHQRVRFYTPNLAPLGAYAWEAEYESLAEFEKARDARYAAVSPEVVKKFFEMVEIIGGTNEIWNLE